MKYITRFIKVIAALIAHHLFGLNQKTKYLKGSVAIDSAILASAFK